MSKDKNIIIKLYLDEESIPEINKKTGVCLSTIRYLLMKNGVLRSRADALRLAAQKGKLGSGLRGKKRPPFSLAHRENLKKAAQKRPSRGVSLKPNGYVEFTRGINKGRSVHVITMEKHIGRHILSKEVVHHKGIKYPISSIINRQDNRIENLRIMTRSEHSRLHRAERTSGLYGKF